MNKRLQQAFRVNKESVKQKRTIIRAILGNGKGVVETSRANHVYARTTDDHIVVVLNKKVANKDGLAVFLGFTEEEPFVMQVLGEFNAYNIVADTQLPAHAQLHQWPYGDTVYVHGEQFTPWLVVPYSGTSVQLYGGLYYSHSGTIYTPTQYVDMQAYVPTTGSLYALLALGVTGAVVIQEGALRTSKDVLIPGDIPVPVSGAFPIAAIRMYAGQSVISKTAAVRDIVDLRWSGYSVVSDTHYVYVYNNGVLILQEAQGLDFTGAGVTVTSSGSIAYINIPGGGGGGGGVDQIGVYGQDEGVPLGSGTVLNIVGAGASMTLSGTVLNLNVPGGTGVSVDGWIAYSAVTPTRASADDPTYVLTFAGVDLTSLISVGMRLKWTQNSTIRYGIVTAIAFSTNTTLTLYGGTDYDVDDTASYTISAFNYSPVKAPLGFPLEPSKWTVTVTDSNDPYKTSPTQNVWYGGSNAWTSGSSVTIDAPIGAWIASFVSVNDAQKASSPTTVLSCLSDDGTSPVSNKLTSYSGAYTANNTSSSEPTDILEYASKTTLYLLLKTAHASVTQLKIYGSIITTTITLECAYL